jgi:deferrochelatase/peroxidase EfeB
MRSVVDSAGPAGRSSKDTWVSVALSYQGLKVLGVPQASLDSFSPEFRQGMAARAKSLGDSGESSPEHWEKPLGSTDVHVVVTAVAPGAEQLQVAFERARKVYQELKELRRSGVRIVMLPGEREAFGSGTASVIPR